VLLTLLMLCWAPFTADAAWRVQDPGIAAAAARFTLALGPALFMDAADQCCRRYLSAQGIVQVCWRCVR
jgi:hypothetical protein